MEHPKLDRLCSHVCLDGVSDADSLFRIQKLKSVMRNNSYVIVPSDSAGNLVRDNKIGTRPILGVFDVSNILSFDQKSRYSKKEYLMYVLAKGNCKSPEEVKTGCYRGCMSYSQPGNVDSWRYDILNRELQDFLEAMLDWTIDGIVPENPGFYTTNVVNIHDSSVEGFILDPYRATHVRHRMMSFEDRPVRQPFLGRLDEVADILYYGRSPYVLDNGVMKPRLFLTGMKNGWEVTEGGPNIGDIFIRSGSSEVILVTEENVSRLKEGIVVRVKDRRNQGSVAVTLMSKVFREINRIPVDGSLDSMHNMSRAMVLIPGDRDYWNENMLPAISGQLPTEKYEALDLELRQAIPREDDLYSAIMRSINRDINAAKLTNISEMVSTYYRESILCRDARAYLSSTVMMGSVLEVVVIDWLNEMIVRNAEKNLFEDKVKLKDLGSDNPDSLCGYIKEIGKHYLEDDRDYFMECANYIRHSRNKLHPREYMKSPFTKKEYDKVCRCFRDAVQVRLTFRTK